MKGFDAFSDSSPLTDRRQGIREGKGARQPVKGGNISAIGCLKVWMGLALAGMALFFTGCGMKENGNDSISGVPEYVFTYAENQAEDYPTSLGAYRFAELVKEKTGGRIEIQVKAGGLLGDEQAILEQLQFGGVDFTRVSLSPLSEIVPELNVLQMPYIYTGSEHMWKVLDGEIGEIFIGFFEGIPIQPLAWYDGGTRNFYTSNMPIRSLEDMKGMRIRVQQSSLMEDTMESLGAEAVPTAFDQVYSSLQRGTIDGAENSWPSYESEKHYEVAGYYILDEHTRVPEMQLASQVTWDKLSKEDQQIIRECARESATYQRIQWKEREKSSEERVRAEGCQVILLSEEEKERFREAVAPLYEKYCSDYMDIVEAIRNAGKEP